MKILFKVSAFIALSLAMGVAVTSCVSETPFDAGQKEGSLSINAKIRGEISVATRTANYDQTILEENLVVYVERVSGNEAGLIKKIIGLDNIPTSMPLPVGSYVLEAWTGDSVSASWDKKFYRCYQPVDIRAAENKQVELHCNIANVIVSVTPESLECGMNDFTISFWHSHKGQDDEYALTFTSQEITDGAKGYFMMPTADHVTGAKEEVLHYHISGTKSDGTSVEEDGDLENVKAAHEYKVTVKADKSDDSVGGALIQLEIADIPVIDGVIEIFPAPSFKLIWGIDTVSVEDQINLTGQDVYDTKLTCLAFNGVKSVNISFNESFDSFLNDYFEKNSTDNNYRWDSSSPSINILNEATRRDVLKTMGIQWEREWHNDALLNKENGLQFGIAGLEEADSIQYDDMCLTFTAAFLKSLPPSTTEYVVSVEVNDGFKNSKATLVRFANTEDAIEFKAPVGSVDMSAPENIDYTAITTTSATLSGEVYSDEATDYGIKYRESGTSEWTKVSASSTRAGSGKFTVTITNLTPGTNYEYKAYCDGLEKEFEENTSRTFTTESPYIIPNAGLEDWSDLSSNKKVLIPGAGGTVSFWDTGNHGSATMSKLVTNKSEGMKHGGNASAELKSQFVGIGSIGKFAAGNLFVGSYDKTDGTDGELTFGRPYNGSHPKALTLYANYRPGTGVSKKGADADYIAAGATDKGQIYVALTTSAVSIKTKSKALFDPEAEYVIAYGEVTWDGDFGSDGVLDKVTIPLEYDKTKVKTVRPTHIVIVCSSSKFGDFFSGGEGSTMYVDDFELEY